MERKKHFCYTLMTNTRNVTMKDVAKLAGVSTATVSRALMSPEKVSAVTRQRVINAVNEIGYLPHTAIRHFKRNDSFIILIIIPNITNANYDVLIKGIQQTLNEYGYVIVFAFIEQITTQYKIFGELILNKHIDGIILINCCFPFIKEKREQKNIPPMVMINEFVPELELPTIHVDNLTASFNAVNYLYQIGHYRIAMICCDNDSQLNEHKKQGYIHALHRNGIAIEERYICSGNLSYETGVKCFTTLMTLPQPPTAIFCHNDIIALGALSQAKKSKFNVPNDLSIMGFDNISLAQYSDPALSTIALPDYEMGEKAALLLIRQIKGEIIKKGSFLFNSELLIRDSTTSPY